MSQFRTCIGTLGVNLTEQETQMLLDKDRVTDGSGLVCYRDLVNNLDTVFSDAVNPSDVIQNARTSAVSYKNWPFEPRLFD